MSEPVRVSGAELWLGDCRDVLAGIPAESVHACVTSPPYWGLRDYQVAGQIGLEASVAEYVADLVGVFREVRRVLRPDGVVFLNLGDAYSDGGSGANGRMRNSPNANRDGTSDAKAPRGALPRGGAGLKPKDLIGLPWRVAFALQEPHHYGPIRREVDRAWLAALVDGEGTIGIRRHDSYSNGGDGRTPAQDGFIPFLSVANNDRELLDRCVEITGYGSVRVKNPIGEDQRGIVSRREGYAWRLDANKAITVIREIFPYLIAKRRQAILAYTLKASNEGGKALRGNGRLPAEEQAKREQIKALCNSCNQRQPVDMPAWCLEPPSMVEQGWWLRAENIWHKPNPMPESVEDRTTRSHEQVFMLSKGPRYFYDAAAVREAWADERQGRDGSSLARERNRGGRSDGLTKPNNIDPSANGGCNLRSVWTIATQPFGEAHFATMPPALAERCIKAGCPAGGTVLDPFAGAGTTLLVAERLQRRSIGIELNPAYVEMAARRLRDDASLFAAPPGPAPGREEVAASVAEDQKALL